MPSALFILLFLRYVLTLPRPAWAVILQYASSSSCHGRCLLLYPAFSVESGTCEFFWADLEQWPFWFQPLTYLDTPMSTCWLRWSLSTFLSMLVSSNDPFQWLPYVEVESSNYFLNCLGVKYYIKFKKMLSSISKPYTYFCSLWFKCRMYYFR
jgi:hypothetical protein